MSEWQIGIAVILPIVGIILLIGLFYYKVLPFIIVKKLRSGEDGVTYPENFKEFQKKVTVEQNQMYHSGYEQNTYDIYRPHLITSKGVVVWVHGGFFIAGDKKGTENLCTFLASNGITVVSMNYALAPERKYPTALRQIDELITHIQSNETLDTSRIILAGDSAGGQMVSEYVSLITNPSLRTKSGITFKANCKIAGTILVCAPIEIGLLAGLNKKMDRLLPIFGRAYYGTGKWYRKERYQYIKTIEHVTENYPPTFLTDGNHFSFESQNKEFAFALKEKGVEVTELFFEHDKVEHEYVFKMSEERAMFAANEIKKFIKGKLYPVGGDKE